MSWVAFSWRVGQAGAAGSGGKGQLREPCGEERSLSPQEWPRGVPILKAEGNVEV